VHFLVVEALLEGAQDLLALVRVGGARLALVRSSITVSCGG
jgi:hypothetical protein